MIQQRSVAVNDLPCNKALVFFCFFGRQGVMLLTGCEYQASLGTFQATKIKLQKLRVSSLRYGRGINDVVLVKGNGGGHLGMIEAIWYMDITFGKGGGCIKKKGKNLRNL